MVAAITIRAGRSTKAWRDRTIVIKDIHRAFRDFLRDKVLYGYAIDAIVLEGYSYASRFQSHQLGELGFDFRRYMHEYHNDSAYIIPPKRLAKFITGNGNSSKKQRAGFIHDLYGLEFDNLHLSDACAAALFGLALSGISDRFTEDQMKLVREYG